jgi:hypothetical protein
MTIATIDTSRINNPHVAAYLASTDRRVTIGVRFALEMFGIEVPDFLKRKPSGRSSVATLMAAADADTGTIHTYRAEKLRVGPFAPRP